MDESYLVQENKALREIIQELKKKLKAQEDQSWALYTAMMQTRIVPPPMREETLTCQN